MRIIGALLPLALLPLSGTAQPLSSHSTHFGAVSIPTEQALGYWGLSLDRFTPNGKETDRGIYNGIDQTIGLNFLNYSFARRSARWNDVYYRATVQLGYGHDQPTEFLQNTFHRAVDSLPVVSMNPRNNVPDVALNFEADYWGNLGKARGFAGGGFAVGTVFQEMWFHAGNVHQLWSSPLSPTVSTVLRLGFVAGGGAFPDSTLTDRYYAFQIAVRFPMNAWLWPWPWPGAPDLVVQLGTDTGFFANADGTGIGEKLGSIALHGPNDKWVLELWNDYFGFEFKDKGPTFGLRIYFEAANWSRLLSWLP